MAHLLQPAAQRGMVRVHDLGLMVLETERLERPLQATRVTAAGAHLLDPQTALSDRREHAIPARLALPVFPGRWQPTHASPPIPGGRGRELLRAPCRAPARRAAPW